MAKGKANGARGAKASGDYSAWLEARVTDLAPHGPPGGCMKASPTCTGGVGGVAVTPAQAAGASSVVTEHAR